LTHHNIGRFVGFNIQLKNVLLISNNNYMESSTNHKKMHTLNVFLVPRIDII